MQRPLLGGTPTASYIALEHVPTPTSVAEANSSFSARAGAAILYAANISLPDNANGNEQDYGFHILAKMAYSDYFTGSDQIPGRNFSKTLRDEVSTSVAAQKPGVVGTPVLAGGEYDVLLTAYLKLYYRYYHALSADATTNLFNTLLTQRGKYDPGEAFSLSVNVAGSIPETENHRLMIQSAKYLTNQLYYQASVAEGLPDHANFDNNRNGDGDTNPPMVDVMLQALNSFLKLDFVEYNARPYQDYTMSALLNLVSFSYDDRVRLAARMVLDYVSAKVALSSQDLRRCPPFRRRNEDQFFGPIMPNGFLGSPLVFNIPSDDPKKLYEPDPQNAFYTMLAGNIGLFAAPQEIPFPSPFKGAPGNYAFEMVHAGLSDYRVPPAILDLFLSRRSRNFIQGFHHHAGPHYVRELYAGSPSYLISAGGNASSFAYTASLLDIVHPGASSELGLAMPTIFIPSSDCEPQTGGFGFTLADTIQFGKFSADPETVNLGVAPNFACGGPIYVPDTFEPAQHVGTPKLVSDGNWTFVDRGSDGTRPGYYLAIFRAVKDFLTPTEHWGFLEAYDTLLNLPGLTFAQFQAAVKATNPSIVLQFGIDNLGPLHLVETERVNTYVTQASVTQPGQQIQFTLEPHSAIVSTSAEPDGGVYTNAFAHGSVVNSEQIGGPQLPQGSGLITISNPAVGTITLNMQVQAAAGDRLFGLHHPTRTSETGEVESAGANEEVWVDSHYPCAGPTAGDFGDPFRSLGQAIDVVAVGGTVRMVNVGGLESGPISYTKRMTLKATGGPITLPR